MSVDGPSVLRLEGAKNFRDLGGLWVGDGRTVRHGVVYRSEALSALSQKDLQLLDGIGISVAYDLRTPVEREAAPVRWLDGRAPEIIGVEAEAAEAAHGSLIAQKLATEARVAFVREAMLETYRAMPAAFAQVVGAVADDVIRARTPVLVSCVAGKDRTGFVAAVLLLAAGVGYETVEDDYLRSNLFFTPERIAAVIARQFGRPASDEAVYAVGVRPEYLRASLDAIDRTYGSLDAYLESQVGLPASRRSELQAALLEPVVAAS